MAVDVLISDLVEQQAPSLSTLDITLSFSPDIVVKLISLEINVL